MKTRRASYPSPADGITFTIRPEKRGRQTGEDIHQRSSKLSRTAPATGVDCIPDDLLISVITSVASTAASPTDLVNSMLTCRRFCAAATHHLVLARAALPAMAVRASRWSDGAHRFLKRCADAGNAEAYYTLGMIHFYCLSNRSGGASLMAKAAMASHSFALHSLAVIQFNGSGGTRKDKDLRAGVALCARAAYLGHVDAMRELGHCLQDGYGVRKNVPEGRRLLLEANAREAAATAAANAREAAATTAANARAAAATAANAREGAATAANARAAAATAANARAAAAATAANARAAAATAAGASASPASFMRRLLQSTLNTPSPLACHTQSLQNKDDPIQASRLDQAAILQPREISADSRRSASLLLDFGCHLPPPKPHIANTFLIDWFELHPPAACGLRLCSHTNCGRLETRKHEFRRCSACATVNYCSRSCQALHWKIRHKYDCRPQANWV